MSGVFWCCCGVAPEPNPCPCNCVCTYPWIFQDYLSDTLDGYIGSLHWDGSSSLLGNENGDPWTLTFWIKGCDRHAERGVLWNTFDPTEITDGISSSRLYINADNRTFTGDLWLEANMRIQREDGLVLPMNLHVTFPGLQEIPPGCVLVILQYKLNDDGKPYAVLTARWLNNGVTQQSRSEVVTPEDGDWKWIEPEGAQTYVGAYYPPPGTDTVVIPGEWDSWPGDGTGIGGYQTLHHWRGCMNNLAIYHEWIEPDSYDYEAIWNEGQGLLNASNPWEYWCPPDEEWWYEQYQYGLVRGTALRNTVYS